MIRVTSISKKSRRLALAALSLCVGFIAIGPAAVAEDKSATKSGLIQLPSPGGTVTSEIGRFTLNRNRGTVSFSIPLPTLPARASGAKALSPTRSGH